MAPVGDNAKLDSARERIPEADRKRSAADIELAGAERRDHLGAGIEHDEVDVEALVIEVAPVISDVEGGVAGRSASAHRDLVRGLRQAHNQIAGQGAGEHRLREPCHCPCYRHQLTNQQ